MKNPMPSGAGRPGEVAPEESANRARRGRALAPWLAVLAALIVLIVAILPLPLVLQRAASERGANDVTTASDPPPPPRTPLPTASGTPDGDGSLREANIRLPVHAQPLEASEADSPDEEPEEEEPLPDEEALEGAWLELEVLDRQTGQPVPGATLELVLADADYTQERRVLRRAGPDGCLRQRIPAGHVRLVAWSDDLAGGPEELVVSTSGSFPITLWMEPTLGLQGRIRDAVSGHAIEGARVSIWTFAETDRVESGADGSFRHPRLPAGPLAQQVRVEAPGYGATVRYVEAGADGSWRVMARVADEKEARGFDGVPWLDVELVPELSLQGNVRALDGTPIPAAAIQVEGYVHVLPSVASHDGGDTAADADGAFALGGLRSDIAHTVYVRAPGFARFALEVPPSKGRENGPLQLEVVLEPERVISGVIVDHDGFPVEDIEVLLHPQSTSAQVTEATALQSLDVSARVLSASESLRTGADGTFVFEGLSDGDFRVVVVRDRELVEERVASHTGETDLTLTLPPECMTIEGVVRGASGSIAGARVEIRREGWVAAVETDAEGRFRVSGLDGDGAYSFLTTFACPRTGSLLSAETRAWAHERPTLLVQR